MMQKTEPIQIDGSPIYGAALAALLQKVTDAVTHPNSKVPSTGAQALFTQYCGQFADESNLIAENRQQRAIAESTLLPENRVARVFWTRLPLIASSY